MAWDVEICGTCGGDGNGRPLQVLKGGEFMCLDCYGREFRRLAEEAGGGIGGGDVAMRTLRARLDGRTIYEFRKELAKAPKVPGGTGGLGAGITVEEGGQLTWLG